MKSKVCTLSDVPHLYEQTLSMIEESFEYPRSNDFESDFYPLMLKENWSNLFLLILNNEVIGHIGCLKKYLKVNYINFPIVLLGGISIKKNFQGQGLFKDFLNHVLTKNSESALYLLWSGEKLLYDKFDFKEVGAVYESKNTNTKVAKEVKLSELTDEQKEMIKTLFQEQFKDIIHIHRSRQDWSHLFNHKTIKCYLTQKEGYIDHYWLTDKGADLNNICHESNSLMSNILPNQFNGKKWTPISTKDANEKILFLCMAKYGNLKYFNQLIQTWSNSKISILSENSILINGEVINLNMSELLQGFFNPQLFKEFVEFEKPIYFCGFDSI